ncbi:unnamed protein product [Calypogeia fissa]
MNRRENPGYHSHTISASQHVPDVGTSQGSSRISSGSSKNSTMLSLIRKSSNDISDISSIYELKLAFQLGSLSQVKTINLDKQDIGSEHLTLAEALASGQMSALEELLLWKTGLVDDRGAEIGHALAKATFPCLTSIVLGMNVIGTEAVEALARAIRCGNLERLEQLSLSYAGINDDDMAALTKPFQYGKASVLPNLRDLWLDGNNFTQVGLQSLAEALKSGGLNSLRELGVTSSSNLCEQGAEAIVSALAVNSLLVVEVDFDWHLFPDLDRRQKRLRERNLRQRELLASFSDYPMVPATHGKVYLCGSPEVGKTTLRRTLQRTFFESLWTWERWPHEEPRTRGIDVTQVSSKGNERKTQNPITLFIWDMAGQQDYHLVHNSFFPDLSFSEGKTTIFVIVCDSKNLDEAKQQLGYWLRYIASSCHKTTKQLRHVFVILNNIGGDTKVQGYGEGWKKLLEDKRDHFGGFLEVHTDPFVVDVRRRGKVSGVKICLLEHSRKLLEVEEVPEICKIIQRNLPIWGEARKEFPVLDWEEFLDDVEQLSNDWPHELILSATKYLSEAGVLIYIDKNFPAQWRIPYRRLIVLNPNWFCKEIIGNMFVSEDMVNPLESDHLFRKKVDPTTGSISMPDFKRFFKSRWSAKNCEYLIAVLLWLGLCYKGKEENVFIPSLIDKNGEHGDPWQSHSAHGDEEEQWVMGFSIEHKTSEMTLAPMSLWHRFQVQVAQTPKFNGEVPDNDFVAGKYFMTFTVEYMNVLIEVNAKEDIPTFDAISIFVKPKFRKEALDRNERKQFQVNLADDLVEILLGLWDDICGGVEYVQRVVWPWPVSQSRPTDGQNKNVEVAQVKKWVQMHGMGRTMQWTVGSDGTLAEDQLLSTRDKKNVILSAQNDLNVLRQGLQEAVNLKIYPRELTEESGVGSNVWSQEEPGEESRVASHGKQEASQETRMILQALHEVGQKVDKVDKKLDAVQNGLAKVLNEQNRMFRKLQETERFFKEDKDRTCPNLIYLGERDSGVWTTLKQALSPTVNVRLHFACEAMFNNYRPHKAKDQQGLDVSALKPFLKKMAPWLKVSLTIKDLQ